MKTTELRAAWRTAIGIGCLAATIALPCAAQTTARPAVPIPAAQRAEAPPALVERLQALYPATRFGAVSATAWPGVYEVAMGANLAYVDESGQYFLFGHLFDMKSQRDLTAERREVLARIDFAALPLADALKEVRGSGARTFAIFSDPDCPHCRKLESDLKSLSDVTIYTFLMPIASLHPDARGKAIAVWCASDPIAAWHALMLRDQVPANDDCPHPVDRNVALGERLGIAATPTLVAADGRMLAGVGDIAQFEAWLVRSPVAAQGARQPGSASR